MVLNELTTWQWIDHPAEGRTKGPDVHAIIRADNRRFQIEAGRSEMEPEQSGQTPGLESGHPGNNLPFTLL